VHRLNRVKTESARDPKFTYTPQQFILSYGETALYISVMGDPKTGVAPLEYVKVFFGRTPLRLLRLVNQILMLQTEEERLPYAEGWRPPAKQTTLMTLGQMIIKLYTTAGDILPEGLEITTNTLKLAFGGYDPLTGLLVHAL
jgi:hypothetical protein